MVGANIRTSLIDLTCLNHLKPKDSKSRLLTALSCVKLIPIQLTISHGDWLFTVSKFKRTTWSLRSVTDDNRPNLSATNESGGGTRLIRTIQAIQLKLIARLKALMKNLPVKIFSFLVGFYCATAFATVIGQTGDWDVLSAALTVAVVEGIGALMYKASLPVVDNEEGNFIDAISNMSCLRHPNVVALAGFCVEHGQRLLVHDYIGNGNGSLHDMLHFADERSMMLTWNARVRVALGTARALEYLHEVCLPSVVHRNLKSANILLDEELNPHLSDCGLASLTPNTERQVSSTQMIGSFGYSPPEFALSGIYTVKSDVYSFGVVMLELLTGRKPLDSSRVRSEQSLVRWAAPQLHDIDALAKMLDPSLNGMYPAKSLSRFADIIALCVQPEPEFRPPMSEVVQALVRLMQRASIVKRRSSEESSFAFRSGADHEATDLL